jgi:hypothetical protein
MNSPDAPSFFYKFKNEGFAAERGASLAEPEYKSKGHAG